MSITNDNPKLTYNDIALLADQYDDDPPQTYDSGKPFTKSYYWLKRELAKVEKESSDVKWKKQGN